jgi:hypothetical protein
VRALDARLGRALIARDYLNVRIRHWQPDEASDEILYFFESFLLSLTGAIDVFARLLHVAFGLQGGRRRAGFQRADWRAALLDRAASQQLAALLAPDAPFIAAVTLIGTLRNFVHNTLLTEELLRDSEYGPEIMNYGRGVIAVHDRSAPISRHGA